MAVAVANYGGLIVCLRGCNLALVTSQMYVLATHPDVGLQATPLSATATYYYSYTFRAFYHYLREIFGGEYMLPRSHTHAVFEFYLGSRVQV